MANGVLTTSMEGILLHQLGVSPSETEPWPLTVRPRALAVLAEVLLLKQQQEREAGNMKCASEATIIRIWTQFLSTLTNAIVSFDNNTQEFEGNFALTVAQ